MRVISSSSMRGNRTSTGGKCLTVARLKPIVLRVTKRYGATNVRIFGSFARGEQRATSDIDLLVDLPENTSLFDPSGLKIDLEEALQRKVDVLTVRSLSPYLRERILQEAKAL